MPRTAHKAAKARKREKRIRREYNVLRSSKCMIITHELPIYRANPDGTPMLGKDGKPQQVGVKPVQRNYGRASAAGYRSAMAGQIRAKLTNEKRGRTD